MFSFGSCMWRGVQCMGIEQAKQWTRLQLQMENLLNFTIKLATGHHIANKIGFSESAHLSSSYVCKTRRTIVYSLSRVRMQGRHQCRSNSNAIMQVVTVPQQEQWNYASVSQQSRGVMHMQDCHSRTNVIRHQCHSSSHVIVFVIMHECQSKKNVIMQQCHSRRNVIMQQCHSKSNVIMNQSRSNAM